MKKNKSLSIMLLLVLSFMMVLPVTSYAQNHFEHDHTGCTDCVEHVEADSLGYIGENVIRPQALPCPRCETGGLRETVLREPTCENEGLIDLQCNTCSFRGSRQPKPLGHDFPREPKSTRCTIRIECRRRGCRTVISGEYHEYKNGRCVDCGKPQGK